MIYVISLGVSKASVLVWLRRTHKPKRKPNYTFIRFHHQWEEIEQYIKDQCTTDDTGKWSFAVRQPKAERRHICNMIVRISRLQKHHRTESPTMPYREALDLFMTHAQMIVTSTNTRLGEEE